LDEAFPSDRADQTPETTIQKLAGSTTMNHINKGFNFSLTGFDKIDHLPDKAALILN
jgi:hypothetical protein